MYSRVFHMFTFLQVFMVSQQQQIFFFSVLGLMFEHKLEVPIYLPSPGPGRYRWGPPVAQV